MNALASHHSDGSQSMASHDGLMSAPNSHTDGDGHGSLSVASCNGLIIAPASHEDTNGHDYMSVSHDAHKSIFNRILEVTLVQFLEFNTTRLLLVTNQENIYAGPLELKTGESITFSRVRQGLDPIKLTTDQLDKVPGGA